MSTPEFFTLSYDQLLIETIDPGTGIPTAACAVADTDPLLCDKLWLSVTPAGGDLEQILTTLDIGDTIQIQQPDPDSNGLFVMIGSDNFSANGYWELRLASVSAGPAAFTDGDPAEVVVENSEYVPGGGGNGSFSYATVDEFARLLELIPTPAQTVQLQRELDTAASEIDHWLGRTEPFTEPYPALVVQVNLERAHEHHQQQGRPFGIMVQGDSVVMTATDSFKRHGEKLAVLKSSWGVA